MVVAGGYVGGKRSEGIEWGFVARRYLSVHVFAYLMHRHVSGAFDEHLHSVGPSLFGEFAEHIELEELRCVVGIVD